MRMTAPAAAAFAALAAAVLMLGAVPEARAQFSVLGLKNSLVQFVLSQVSVEGRPTGWRSRRTA
jgi:hypothetical protein